MIKMKTIEGNLNAQEMKTAIVVGRFNEFISGKLLEGAVDALKRHGMDELILMWSGYLDHLRYL